MKRIKLLSGPSILASLLCLSTCLPAQAEFNYDGYFRDQEGIKLADEKVLSEIPENERTILLSKESKEDEYKKLGKKYREKCDAESDAVSCYLYSRMTSNSEKRSSYMEKSCSTGTFPAACLAFDISTGFAGASWGSKIDYGFCMSGYNLNYCRILFLEEFEEGLRGIAPGYQLFAVLDKMEHFSPYEVELKLNKEALDDATYEQLEGFRGQLSEVQENITTKPWFKTTRNEAGSEQSIYSLYNLTAFIDLILEGADYTIPSLRAGCSLFVNKDMVQFLRDECSPYLSGISNSSYKITDDDLKLLKQHCLLTTDIHHKSESCDIVLNHIEKKEAEELKLELCKINKDSFSVCSELLDGF